MGHLMPLCGWQRVVLQEEWRCPVPSSCSAELGGSCVGAATPRAAPGAGTNLELSAVPCAALTATLPSGAQLQGKTSSLECRAADSHTGGTVRLLVVTPAHA